MLTEALHDHDRHLPIGYLPLSRQPRASTHQGPLPCRYSHNQPEKMAPVKFVCLKLMARTLCGCAIFTCFVGEHRACLPAGQKQELTLHWWLQCPPGNMCASLIIHCLTVLLAHSVLWVQ